MANRVPRISFGLIVLNGEPFTKYCLRSLYPFAYEIIVVEGAVHSASGVATPDGHSRDGTLEALYEFKSQEDPEDKLLIIARDGFWDEKDEMSNAYAEKATGDYLWQVDIDEFYKAEDMERVLAMLREDPSISAVSFKQIQFWGGVSYFVDSWYLRMGGEEFHRLFRWGRGYRYLTHRPPTVLDPDGRDTRTLNWVDAYQMERQGIFLYHYSLVFPKQVWDKCQYYQEAKWAQRSEATKWADRVFLKLDRPYRVHNVYEYPGWLERFTASHPSEIEALRSDLNTGRVNLELRANSDIEELLCSRKYRVVRAFLKLIAPTHLYNSGFGSRLQFYFYRFLGNPSGALRSLAQKIAGGNSR